jgi:hypothetical protein
MFYFIYFIPKYFNIFTLFVVCLGFLELNPAICHGCGAPFQSKTPDSPGYLKQDKMVEHQIRAGRIKEEQETIKILQQG